MTKMVKLIIIGIAVAIKLFLILKYIHAVIKFKYLAIAAGYLVLNGVKLWLYAKQQKDGSTVVHYTHSTHDLGYDNEEDEWSGENWKRKTRVADQNHGFSEVPYSRHKATYPFLRQQDDFF